MRPEAECYLVMWIDSMSLAGPWLTEAEIHENHQRIRQPIRTIGYLAYEDEQAVTICASQGNSTDMPWSECITIPKLAIERRQKIDVEVEEPHG